MSRNPFASLVRKQRLQARLGGLQRSLLRPLRPTRIDPDRPGPANLLLVGIDTLRADHLGIGGCGRPVSPRIDALATGGTVFADVSAPAPWTLPSFASALSGVMPGLHGAYLDGDPRNMDTQPPRRLDPATVTLAAHLRERGYRTAAFYSNQFFAFGLAETFDEHHYLNLAAADLAAVALDWVRRHADRPFFCFVLFNDPHEPTTPAPGDLEPFLAGVRARGAAVTPEALAGMARWGGDGMPHLGRAPQPPDPDTEAALALKLAIYDATIHEVDRTVGAMQDRLAAWRLAERTLVSIFADHGEEFLDHGREAARWDHDPRGLAGIGHGHSQFQELLHVPWAAWGPGVPAGRRETAAVSLCDLAPTLCDWLEAGPFTANRKRLAGRCADLAPALLGRSRSGEADAADSPLLAEALAYGPDLVMVRRGRWKLIAHRDGRPLALYDLDADRRESQDLLATEETVAADLLGLVARWRESGCGATGGGGAGGSWQEMDATVRQRLKDLGYSE